MTRDVATEAGVKRLVLQIGTTVDPLAEGTILAEELTYLYTLQSMYSFIEGRFEAEASPACTPRRGAVITYDLQAWIDQILKEDPFNCCEWRKNAMIDELMRK